MAKKKKKAMKPHREPTRRQLAHWQKQKKRQRIILITGITIIAAAVIIVASGWYIGEYRPMNETVIRVNDTEFKMKYYVDTLELAGVGQSPEYAQYLADRAIQNIEQNELTRQGALKLGISISDDEVKEEIKKSEVANNAVNRDLFRTDLLTEKLRDEYFDKQVPEKTPQRHVMAMLLESESQSAEVRERLEGGESFTELAGELSLDYFSQAKEGDFGWHPDSIFREIFTTNTTLDYVLSAKVGELSQPVYDEKTAKTVGYWLLKVADRDEEAEEAHVYAMLLGSEDEAKDVRARLEAGESFSTLAAELSQFGNAEEDEGDMGMVLQGEMPAAADEYVFNDEIELGTLSEPIRDDTMSTQGGYWLISVPGESDERTIDTEDRRFLVSRLLDEWVTSLWDDPDNDIDHSYLDEAKMTWAIERLM